MIENVREFIYSKFEVFKKTADAIPNEELYNLECGQSHKIPILHWLSHVGYSDYEAVDGSDIEANRKIEYLLKRGYDVNKPDKDGYTALLYAMNAGNLTTAIILLQNKANPFTKTPWPEYDTVYDYRFDKDGNYRDFAYRSHDEARSEVGSPKYVNDTKILEDRLQTIRALCKPEYEGKEIFSHEYMINKKKDEIRKRITENEKMTSDIREGMAKTKESGYKHISRTPSLNKGVRED